MRLARIVSFVLLVVAVVVGGAAALVSYNQHRIVTYVLASVRERTGVDIVPRASSVRLGNHLIVDLESPVVVVGGDQLVKMKSLRAIISYHSIVTSTGIPLYRLSADSPEIALPTTATQASAAAVPRPAAETVEAMRSVLRILERIAWRFEVTDGSVRDDDGKPVLDHLDLVTFRSHSDPRVWRVAFAAEMAGASMAGAHIAGKVSAGDSLKASESASAMLGESAKPGESSKSGESAKSDEFARAQFWAWDMPLSGLQAEGFTTAGGLQASLRLTVHDDGTVTGATDAQVKQLMLTSAQLTAPIELGDYSLHAQLNLTTGSYAVTDVTLRNTNTPLASGESELRAPNTANAELGIHIGHFTLDVSGLKRKALMVRHLPEEFEQLLHRIKPGQVSVGDATLSAELEKIRTEPLETIRRNLVVSATISGVGLTMPDEARLPPVENLSAQIRYAKGVLTVSQGSAKVGNSTVNEIGARADLSKGIEGSSYQVQLGVNADLSELAPAIFKSLDLMKLQERQRLAKIGGHIAIAVNASGVLSQKNMRPPAQYTVRADAIGTTIAIKGSPGPLEVRRGTVTVDPKSARIDRLMMAVTGGDATLDGSLIFAGAKTQVRNLTLDVHKFPSAIWLALVMDPNDLGVRGDIGGRVVLNSDPKNPEVVLPEGKLTLANGEVQFNFLRAPVVVQGATLTMHNGAVVLAMPGSKLENQPIDMKVSVPNFRKPAIVIDANVAKLDLEVMKFIRMPWSPATPPINFPIPCSGHIVAKYGNLSAFQMKDIKTDFWRDAIGDWQLYNFVATAYRGRMKVDLTGRAPDNWIHIQASAADMDPGPLFMLSGKNKQPPLSGHLFFGSDMWANTDTDFFNTMAGDISVTVRDGSLEKFTLLSRLLAFIDIKNWLTAQLPDPRVSGVPFTRLMADFKGNGGLFYTDNFVLQGPVMDIAANGSIKFGEGTLDMEVGMAPFDTVDWVLNKIPLVGERIGSGTGKLVAAYVQVEGPVSDPSITPKPITSVAEFVKKTLGLPINIIRPNTIK